LRASPAKLGLSRATLLWIDDFEPALVLYKATMENLGFRVLTASNGEAGVKLAALNHVDLVVTDYEMPHMNGEAVASAIKALDPSIPIVMFSGNGFVPPRARRFVDAFCDKAGCRDLLLAAIHRLLQKKGSRSLQPTPVVPASHDDHRTVA
jgi:CheY-like chemotaxis protein